MFGFVNAQTSQPSAGDTAQLRHVGLDTRVVLVSEETKLEISRSTLGEWLDVNSDSLTIADCQRIGDDLRASGQAVVGGGGAAGSFVLRLDIEPKTTGEWIISTVSDGTFSIHRAPGPDPVCHDVLTIEDAKLIAAAGDMRAALEEVWRKLSKESRWHVSDLLLKRVKPAIIKAGGAL